MDGAPSDSGTHSEPALWLKDDCVMWREIEDEVIVLDKRTWNYLGINGSGAVLWREIVQGTTRKKLIASLCETFRVSDELASRDVERFLTTLREHKFLEGDAA
jgi:hypothetical protein